MRFDAIQRTKEHFDDVLMSPKMIDNTNKVPKKMDRRNCEISYRYFWSSIIVLSCPKIINIINWQTITKSIEKIK